MSAAEVILPQVWAMTRSAERNEAPAPRKRPHNLYLVKASAETASRSIATPSEAQFAFYRKYTEAMLQRFMKLSLESGRVPSLMGRELFRGNVSHCTVDGFDDVVIFVHDVGNCIARLSPGKQHLVRRIALQGYTHGETAAMLGIGLSTVARRYNEALDRLTGMLIERNLLKPLTEAHAGG